MPNTKSKGIYFALITAFISGVSIFLNKFAVAAIKEPLVFTTVKNTAVALIILTLLISSGQISKIKKLTNIQKKYLLFIGVIGGSIPFYLFFTGLSMVPAINAAIIQKTLVLWVAFIAIPLLKEKLSRTGWLAVLILFAANAFVGGFNGFRFSKGELYILLATVFWAFESVLVRKVLPKIPADIVAFARMGIGAIVLLMFSVFLKPQALTGVFRLNLDGWLWIALTAGLLTAYVTTWYRGIKYAPVTLVTAVLVGSTLVTNILSAVFVTHSLNTVMLIQSVIIALGIFVLYKTEVVQKIKIATA